MAGTRIFDVSIVSGTSHSLYTIYYDLVNASNIATLFSGSTPATGITYNTLSNTGVRVVVPDTATKILLYNDSCQIDDQIILPTPTPSPSPTPSSTPTPTPTPTPNCDFGVDIIVTTPTPTPSATPTATPTPSPSSTPTPTPTPNCNFDVDVVVTTPTPTPSSTPTPTPTPSPTISPTPTPSPTPSPTISPTPTPSPTTSPTPTPSPSPSPTPTPTPNCDFGVDVYINQGPTGFTPTLLSQNEGTATGTTIATFSAGDPNVGDTHTFSLVSGTGGTDNASFTLSSAGVLKNAVVFDRETKSSYSIRVRVTDQGGLWFEDTRIVVVSNVNETPYGLTLSNNSQNENTATGTTIGTFTGLDVDAGDTFTYSLIDPGGNSDESKFTLGSTTGILKNAIVFNYEAKNSYTITVRVTDAAGAYYEDDFTISVLDVNETPTDISLSNSSIDENTPTGSTVGTFSTTDPDSGNTFTYSLVNGLGDTNNGSFYFDGAVLKSAEVFNYEVKSSYSIRVRSTDQGGLFREEIVTINITNITVSGSLSITNPLCYGGNGTIEVTGVTGGSSPYTYSINGTTYQTSTSFTKTAGTYTIYIKDSNGEIGTVNATITQPTNISFSVQDYVLPECNGDSNGSITVTASGGVTPYEYSKDGVEWQTETTFSNLANGTYTLRVKDANQCIKTTTQTLNRTVITSTISTKNVDCNGNTTGSITVGQPSGGTGTGYKVKLGSGGTYETVTYPKVYSTLGAGTYHVYIKDSNECEYLFTRVITQPTALDVTETSKRYPTCHNLSDGEITVSGSGGTSPYEYSINLIDWQSSGTFTGLTQNTYGVFVKDAKECTDSVLVDIRKTAVSASISITGATCNGDTNGAIAVTNGSGGSGSGYKVKLGDGAYFDIPKTFTTLGGGSYTITVKDSLDCETVYTRTVSQPAAITATTTFENPSCSTESDGSITVSASGGTSPYTYSINGGTYQALNTFPNLGNGTYTISVKDSNGCLGSTVRTLNTSAVGSNISVTGVTCNGGSNGRVSAGTPYGGNGPTYQYRWRGGTWTDFPSTVTFTNLPAGTYTFEVRDVDGCTSTYSVGVSQPSAVSVIVSASSAPTCHDGENGSVTLSASGGTGTKLYSLNGVNYFTSGTFTGLAVGSYIGYAKDSNNCVDTVSFSLTKSSPTATISQTNIACNGGKGTITVSNPTGGNGGGTFSNYDVKLNSGSWISFSSTSYQFTNVSGGINSIYIRDNSDCVSNAIGVYITEPSAVNAGYSSATAPTCDGGSNGSITWTRSGGTSPYTLTVNGSEITSLTQTGLTEGTYTLTVEDSNGCTDTASVTLSKSPVTVSTTVVQPTCSSDTGTVTINSISGGNLGPYSHKLGNNSYRTTLPYTYELLLPFTYTLTVKDGVGCENDYSITINQPPSITFTTSQSNPTCWNGSDGSITVTASGGNGSYQYSKNGGLTWQTSNSFTLLSTGTYSIRVRQSDGGCETSSTSVTLSRSAPSASISTSSVSCYQGADGSITVSNPTGGYGGAAQSYQHKLNDGTYVNFQSTSYTYTNKEAGSYTIWIKDFSGCERSYSVTVGTPSQLTATITSWITGSNGEITVTSAGGTWNKTYRLYVDTTSPYTVGGGTLVATITGVTSGNPSQTFTGLAEGYYYVIVTDAEGCTASSLIQSTFADDGGGGGDPKPDTADIAITACSGGAVFYASSTRLCIDGNLSLPSVSFNLGDVVQFGIGEGCPLIDGATYCGTITQVGIVGTPDAYITYDGKADSCNDFICFE